MTHGQSAKSNGVCLTNGTNIVTKYINGGIDIFIEFKGDINSDYVKRKVDGRVEACLIELAFRSVMEGHTRWMICLLEEVCC